MNLRTLLSLAGAALLPVLAAQAQPASDPTAIWTWQDENASISAGLLKDRFYTNGLDLGWTSPTGAVPDTVATAGRALWGQGQQRIGFDLTQQIYTPAATHLVVPDPYDRPYAGLLMGSLSLLNDTADSRTLLVLSLGAAGPGALAQETQNLVHDILGQAHNAGWGGQIPNTPAAELLAERTWRLPLGAIGTLQTDALPALTVGLGDVRDYLQTGLSVRIGQGLDSDFGVPRIRPGLGGGNAYLPAPDAVAWYAFAGADAQAVGYDLLLQTNPFRAGPHVSPVWDVAELQAGFAVIAGGLRLTIAYVAQTQEFHGQTGGWHQFGSASLSFHF